MKDLHFQHAQNHDFRRLSPTYATNCELGAVLQTNIVLVVFLEKGFSCSAE